MSSKLFVIAAPSGAGKTTLVRALVTGNPELRFSISYTTREKRNNEAEGLDYRFVSVSEFQALRENGELLEHAEVFDNYYGTSRSLVEKHFATGHSVVLEIDWQGARQVRESMPECVTIFVLPPSLAELERRLTERQMDRPDVIRRRLRDAQSDMSHWSEFQYVIINDDIDQAVSDLNDVIAGNGGRNSADSVPLKRTIALIVG